LGRLYIPKASADFNKIVKKAKMKVWLTSMPAVIGAGVFGYAAAYFDQWWILILAGACALWIVLRK